MFAVIKTGGKQYRVEQGSILEIEKIENPGKSLVFKDVLMVDGKIGSPFVSGASVEAEVLHALKKDDKVIIFKKKRRHNYRRKVGHRQLLTVVKVSAINA
mgnify:CR=1 FL=1|jgi:large subunit ribosomal protein L21